MTLAEFLARAWEMLVGRLDGPMDFRIVLQPIMASLLAIRAGRRDAREGRPPYLWSVVTDPARRRESLRHGWRDIKRVFVFAICLDVTYELIVWHWVYPLQAVIVAIVLALVPYALVRGPANRLARRLGRANGGDAKPE